jgi:hypothetical protein
MTESLHFIKHILCYFPAASHGITSAIPQPGSTEPDATHGNDAAVAIGASQTLGID